MPKSTKIFFARLFLILAFPFWFPRMVFWLVYEFFHFHVKEWFPAAFTKPWEPRGEGQRPQLILVRGGRAHEGHEESRLKKPIPGNQARLKLLRLHSPKPPSSPFGQKKARFKK